MVDSRHGSKPNTHELDSPLDQFGFEIQHLSPSKVSGRLLVTPNCCQPFKVLHGGLSAMIAEGLASMGAYIASGFQRVAGTQLSINHLKPAMVGDVVIGEATPVSVGRSIQVWKVQLWKKKLGDNHEEEEDNERTLISSSTVTLLANLPVPDHAKDVAQNFRKYSKL